KSPEMIGHGACSQTIQGKRHLDIKGVPGRPGNRGKIGAQQQCCDQQTYNEGTRLPPYCTSHAPLPTYWPNDITSCEPGILYAGEINVDRQLRWPLYSQMTRQEA